MKIGRVHSRWTGRPNAMLYSRCNHIGPLRTPARETVCFAENEHKILAIQ